jgi:hypothetical protein
MRDVSIEIITSFHFPNHCSSQLVRGSFIPEFLASSFTGPSGLESLGYGLVQSCVTGDECTTFAHNQDTLLPTLFLPESCLEPSSFPCHLTGGT